MPRAKTKPAASSDVSSTASAAAAPQQQTRVAAHQPSRPRDAHRRRAGARAVRNQDARAGKGPAGSQRYPAGGTGVRRRIDKRIPGRARLHGGAGDDPHRAHAGRQPRHDGGLLGATARAPRSWTQRTGKWLELNILPVGIVVHHQAQVRGDPGALQDDEGAHARPRRRQEHRQQQRARVRTRAATCSRSSRTPTRAPPGSRPPERGVLRPMNFLQLCQRARRKCRMAGSGPPPSPARRRNTAAHRLGQRGVDDHPAQAREGLAVHARDLLGQHGERAGRLRSHRVRHHRPRPLRPELRDGDSFRVYNTAQGTASARRSWTSSTTTTGATAS
jgi:hypothetical protein